MSNNAVILLSGGLDSLVSLGLVRDEYDEMLALTFNYGQKSFNNESEASEKICNYYGIKREVITLDWLKKITNTALVADKEIPANIEDYTKSMKAVWVPNRNGLFLNIAACYADSYGYRDIIIGANKEEAATFSDNTIIKITPDGKRQVFLKSSLISGPISLTSDSVGNIYVSNYNTGTVVKITPAGAPSVLISKLDKPYGLHVEGNMLFITCQGSNSIYRKKITN